MPSQRKECISYFKQGKSSIRYVLSRAYANNEDGNSYRRMVTKRSEEIWILLRQLRGRLHKAAERSLTT